jgi:hypothetical protein
MSQPFAWGGYQSDVRDRRRWRARNRKLDDIYNFTDAYAPPVSLSGYFSRGKRRTCFLQPSRTFVSFRFAHNALVISLEPGHMPLGARPAIFDDFFKTYFSVFRQTCLALWTCYVRRLIADKDNIAMLPEFADWASGLAIGHGKIVFAICRRIWHVRD